MRYYIIFFLCQNHEFVNFHFFFYQRNKLDVFIDEIFCYICYIKFMNLNNMNKFCIK